MSKILKFPKNKKLYSDKFLTGVKPDAIGDFIKKQNPHLSLTERKASNRVHEGLARLSIYYGYKKVHNTIRGQGTKNQRQKVPKMGS